MRRFRQCAFATAAVLGLAVLAEAQAANHYMGAVTSINGDTLTVKTAQGDEHTVQVPASAELKRIEPGQTNLNAAVAMQFSELASGDRVLVWVDPNAAGTPQALRVVAIKAADLARKHEEQAAEWQLHGAGGLVKSVNPATGTIVISSGAGAAAKTVIIHTEKSTVLKRYAPASVNYASAQPGPFDAIHPGDQLMARGAKDAATGDVAAIEVVSGSFRNISGLIASLDPSQQTFTIKDLATKKQFTVQVPADAQMRQLPDRLAQVLAARLKGTETPSAAPAAPPAGNSGNARGGAWSQRGGAGGGGTMDPQQMLSRAPAIHFADLEKGGAVMLVATQGDSQVTAITLLAGVEPLLQAPASQDLLANWSMGSGGSESAAEGTQ